MQVQPFLESMSVVRTLYSYNRPYATNMVWNSKLIPMASSICTKCTRNSIFKFHIFCQWSNKIAKKALKFMKKSNFLAAPSARGLWYVVKIYSSILKIPGCATDTIYIRGNKFNRQRWDITFALVPWKDGWIFWSNGSQGVNNLYKRDATCVCLSEF